MTSSQRRTEANRKNALTSSGPRTDEGKAVVSRNAIRHGIFARDLIIRAGGYQENEEEYQGLLEALQSDLEPRGATEHLLVEKITIGYWRLRRLLRYETGVIGKNIEVATKKYRDRKGLHPDEGKHCACESQSLGCDKHLEVIRMLCFPDEIQVQKIYRYESLISREIYRALAALKTLQGTKRNNVCSYTETVGRYQKTKGLDGKGAE